ncbi:hypothetical protein Sste5346_004658 [Sporothrix stenoceras]|uniref:TAFII55 protein conserved region domain-containing protein n=1 Tax=Sporothrix stenoceras TaxID=5173 RepID=A0ABR3Z9W3_9PEZI
MASPPPPAKASKPVTLKLRTPSAASIMANPIVATPSAMSPPPATPGGGMRIVLKRSQPPTPAVTDAHSALPTTATSTTSAIPATPSATTPATVTTQKGRISKPSAKKRAHDFDESDEENQPMAAKPARRALPTGSSSSNHAANPPKRPKLILKKSTLSRTASIVLKPVMKEAPPHSKGEGYDSEEEDREMDPLIEEEFVLRMYPGEQCDYLRRMVDERKIGVPVKDGGAEFDMKWLPGAERRALVTVQRKHFVGVLVDLPTITEGMKTWDKRNFMKSADICQMLLVYKPVADEAEAKSAPLPAMVGKDYRWPHGLTPPMHDCIHRRFRKRLSKKEIKDKEAELQRLLNEDRLAVETKWELFDDGRTADGEDDEDEEMEDVDMDGMGEGEEDAEGEDDAYGEVDVDYFGQQQNQQPQDGQADADAEGEIDEAELMAEFMEEDDEEKKEGADQGADGQNKPRNVAVTAVAEGDAPTPASEGEADNDGDGGDDDDEDDDDDDDLDEDEQARAEQAKGVREDINDLKKNLETLDAQLAATTNALLRKRIEGTRKRVLSELRLKQASIGEIDEEE